MGIGTLAKFWSATPYGVADQNWKLYFARKKKQLKAIQF